MAQGFVSVEQSSDLEERGISHRGDYADVQRHHQRAEVEADGDGIEPEAMERGAALDIRA